MWWEGAHVPRAHRRVLWPGYSIDGFLLLSVRLFLERRAADVIWRSGLSLAHPVRGCFHAPQDQEPRTRVPALLHVSVLTGLR